MYGAAETLANRLPKQEEYIAASPRSRSCRGSSPARSFRSRRCRASHLVRPVLPLTHAPALMPYGLLGDRQMMIGTVPPSALQAAPVT